MNIILDSGMFSAWARGATIDPDRYIEFVKRNEKHLFACVSLDVIPGSPGKSTQAPIREKAECARLSYLNHRYLKRAGLQPIPVFHQFDDFEWLERYLEDGEDYIGLSPYLRSAPVVICEWLDECFTRLTNEKGLPIVKTHGFGMTTHRLLKRYPWFSVDGTRWWRTAAYGYVRVPILRGGRYDYLCSHSITLTNVPNNRRNSYDRLISLQREVREYFNSIGLDIEELRTSDKVRYKAALIFNRELSQQIGRVKFSPGARDHDRSDALGIDIDAVRIFPATTPARPKTEALDEVGVEDRLLSYWGIRDQPADFIANYSQTGCPSVGRRSDQHATGNVGMKR